MGKAIRCSFCNKTRSRVKQMIAGPEFAGSIIYICDQCIDFSYDVIHEAAEETEEEDYEVSFTPKEIKAHLDKYVIGQEDAKYAISVAMYNHYKRVFDTSDIEIDKSNLLMIGPSGSGKTLLVKTVATIFDSPCVIADATTLTESGYVGDDVENLIEMLLEKADYDIEKAQRGIIFIDEIDKISRRSESSTLSRDVSGEGVQQALLKLVEGTVIKMQRRNSSESFDFDTSNVLFVASGAFIGLDKIVRKSKSSTSIGINASIQDKTSDIGLLHEVSPQDIIHYGLIPEFVGRFPVVVTLGDLTEEMLVQILTEPKNNIIQQFKQLFSLDGVRLEFDDKYIHGVAHDSLEKKTGARGLRAIIEKTLQETQFNLPDLAKAGVNKIVVDPTGTPKYIYKRKQQVNKNAKTSK